MVLKKNVNKEISTSFFLRSSIHDRINGVVRVMKFDRDPNDVLGDVFFMACVLIMVCLFSNATVVVIFLLSYEVRTLSFFSYHEASLLGCLRRTSGLFDGVGFMLHYLAPFLGSKKIHPYTISRLRCHQALNPLGTQGYHLVRLIQLDCYCDVSSAAGCRLPGEELLSCVGSQLKPSPLQRVPNSS